jgi:hypothetical protein
MTDDTDTQNVASPPHPYIAAGRLPLYEAGMLNMTGFLLMAVIVLPMILYFYDGNLNDAVMSGLGLLAAYCILTLFFWNRFRTRMSTRPSRSPLHRTEPPMSSAFTGNARAAAVVVEQERQRRFRVVEAPSMWSWQDFVEELESRGIERPRTIIDDATIGQLGSVPLPDHMLEPEAILQSGDEPRKHLITTIIIGAVTAVVLVFFGLWWIALLPLAFAVFSALQLPEVRDATRHFQMNQSETVVGLGTLTDKQRRWTIDNSVMLVQCKRDTGPLMVTIVGEAGHLMMPFTDEKDMDFVKLWQRWNHPNPRPDLVSGAAV